jgi:hypothetical protein
VSPVRDVTRTHRRRRIKIIVLVIITCVSTLLAAPLILLLVAKIIPQPDGWTLLRNVGGSFTGISAILSALALTAIAYTSSLQARQVRTGQVQAVRSAQTTLMHMAILDKDLAQMFGVMESDFSLWKTTVYRNLFFMYLQMAFRVGELSEDGLRRGLSLDLLISSDAIDYWNSSRIAFVAELTDPLGQRFIEIVDEEVLKAASNFSRLRRRDNPEPDGA